MVVTELTTQILILSGFDFKESIFNQIKIQIAVIQINKIKNHKVIGFFYQNILPQVKNRFGYLVVVL